MHSHVVSEIGFWRFSEEWPKKPRDNLVHPIVLTLKKRSMTGTMQHENIGRCEKRPVNAKINRDNPPTEHSGNVQEHCNWKDDQKDFDDEMDEDDIPFIAYKTKHELRKPRTRSVFINRVCKRNFCYMSHLCWRN